MAQQRKSESELHGGQVIPAMQKVTGVDTEKHGAPVPSMQPVPQAPTSQPPAPTAQPQAPTPQPGAGDQGTGGNQGSSGSGSKN